MRGSTGVIWIERRKFYIYIYCFFISLNYDTKVAKDMVYMHFSFECS